MALRYGLFCIAIGFSLGALLRSLLYFGWPALCFMLVVFVVLLAAWYSTRSQAYMLAALGIAAAIAGSGRAMLADESLPGAYAPLLGASVALEGSVIADPDVRETSQRVMLRVSHEGSDARILAVLPLYPSVSYGGRIRVEGVLELPEPFESEGGREFRYDRYLAKDGVYALMPRASFELLRPPEGISAAVFGTLYAAKRAFVDGLENALPEPAAGLAAGILVGAKQGLGRELYDAFITAGLVHILVLSGYNVMIVANALMRLFAFMPRRFAGLIAAASILLFVLASGAGAASVRAGVMAALALFARTTGRTYDALRGLAVVVLLMLAYNPLLLGYDVGFQFSIAATIGLIIGAPIVERSLAFVRSGFLREIASSTIAAQVGVLPILLYQTGNLSMYALPTNLLVLPAIPLAMLLSFIAAVAGIIAPVLAPIAGAPAYLVLAYVIFIGEHAAALPFSGTVVPAFSFIFVIAAYAALIWLAVQCANRQKENTNGPHELRAV